MIAIGEDKRTIYLTRGDTTSKFFRLAFYFPIWNFETQQEEKYTFQLTDKIAFVVKEKKGYTKTEVLRVEKTLAEMGEVEPTQYPEIQLTEEDTKVFDLLDKKSTYWYDIVLNDTTTILGYDKEGASKLIVYPEAEEK
ncbi:MAG: hypothetical protein IJ272_08185 [Clostridia bacterium]|nr:hypothetical protein [Clostridia bacterium]